MRRVAIAGHSFGGITAMTYAGDEPATPVDGTARACIAYVLVAASSRDQLVLATFFTSTHHLSRALAPAVHMSAGSTRGCFLCRRSSGAVASPTCQPWPCLASDSRSGIRVRRWRKVSSPTAGPHHVPT